MGYRIKIRREALRELKDLPGYVRSQARQVIRGLAKTPRPSRAQELRDKPNIFRIWVAGHWRLAYVLEEEEKLIEILRIRHKDHIDYPSLEA